VIIAFVGVQPSLTHVPPTPLFSINAVLYPASANLLDRGAPPWPEPIIIASKFFTDPVFVYNIHAVMLIQQIMP
jgi:hypothetical protein